MRDVALHGKIRSHFELVKYEMSIRFLNRNIREEAGYMCFEFMEDIRPKGIWKLFHTWYLKS